VTVQSSTEGAMRLHQQLPLKRCPHCRIHMPTLEMQGSTIKTQGLDRSISRIWGVYACKACGGLVLAWAFDVPGAPIMATFPQQGELDAEIPFQPENTFIRRRKAFTLPMVLSCSPQARLMQC
jgi:hypothetical protein